MKLTLPVGSNWRTTLVSWSAELTRAGIVGIRDFFFRTWSPILSGSGTMTVTLTGTSYAKYLRIGPIAFVLVRVTVTTGGVATNEINISGFPLVTSVDDMGVGGLSGIAFDGGFVGCASSVSGSQGFSTYRTDGANWGIGTGRIIRLFGILQVS